MAGPCDGSGKQSAVFLGMKQPPLVKHLRRILSEYPDGGQIIKELIQNAEDAGAHAMKILYDGREINRDIGETTAEYTKFFQCPALAVYNDAEFTDLDWEGIRMIECSVKEEDRLKVGRFGLGFKSVFHMTDYPCVISGRYILLMDPQKPPHMVTAMMEIGNLQNYNGMDYKAFLNAINGTFDFGEDVIRAGYFSGTLFWFPLRQCVSQNPDTLLSDNLYNERKVMNLFKEFEMEANSILLFMKTLESIALYVKCVDNVCEELIKVEISDPYGLIRKTREKFNEDIKQVSDQNSDEALYSTTLLTIHTIVKKVPMEVSWMVVKYFVCKSTSETFTKLIQDKNFGYSPLVGVAAQLGDPCVPTTGKIFCCLPLPNDSANVTGLPVHVNGFFALSQNRHHMKWFTDEQMGSATDDKNLLWNQLMISEALPKAYVLIIEEIIKHSDKHGNRADVVSSLYMALPNSNQSLDKWKSVEERLYELIKHKKFLYCVHEQKWISVQEAWFATFKDVPKCLENVQETITKSLVMMKQNYVKVPLILMNTIEARFDGFKDLTPSSFCQMLQVDDVYKDMSTTEKKQMLEYLLRNAGTMLFLEGLFLLPLASGQWIRFQRSADTLVYICSKDEMKLYPGQEGNVLLQEEELGIFVWEQLSNLADKGIYQLKKICIDSRKALLHKTLVQHYDKSSTKFLIRWLNAVWNMLLQLKILESFTDMPLMPIVTGGAWPNPSAIKLCTLSDLLLLKAHKDASLSDNLCKSLQAMSVTVVPHLPQWMPYSVIKDYIFLPNQECVVKLLSKIGKSKYLQAYVCAFNQNSSDTDKQVLLQYMAQSTNIECEAKELLKMLHIFNVAKSQQDPGTYVDLTNESLKYMLSTEIENFHDFLPFPFPILTTNRGEKNLLIQLGVKHISLQSMIVHTIDDMNKKQDTAVNQTFMTYFIKKFNLFERCPEVIQSASSLLFLKAGNEYHKASSLFDPTDLVLQAVLIEESKVPESSIPFSEEYIRVLKCLGLKARKDLTSDILLSVAERLHKQALDGNMTKEMLIKADAFLDILKSNSNVLSEVCHDGRKLSDGIRNLLCVSYKRSATGTTYPVCLPWHSHSYLLCRPSESTGIAHCNLVGGTMPVVEMNVPLISKTFGWNEDPPLSNVFQQIHVLQQAYTDDKKPDILHVVKEIYYHLNSRYQKNMLDQHNGKIVWTGDGFELPTKVIIETKSEDLDIRPYFYNIPVEFKSIHQFFRNIGCLETQDCLVLLNTLTAIRDKHDTTSVDDTETKRDRELVIKVLDQLANIKEKYNVNFNEQGILMLVQETDPNELILLPVSECTYDDDPEYSDDDEEPEIVHLVHPQVSLNIARTLGVKSIKHRTLQDAEEIGLENWSQEEKLTARIHSLLRDGYNDGFSVPKELIQNADDAKATIVKFVYDERTNCDAQSRLLSKGMAECQGPALWVFNNAKFTTNDISNIIKLNGATKENDARRIGKFGLGFCSVYNLTDVPSFVSGTNMVIFDPHGTHLKDAEIGSKDLKGLKINLLKRSLIKRNIDQFRPFHGMFGCNLPDPEFQEFDGTLFRLPLRTRTQSFQSEILQKEYSNNEMIVLFDILVRSAGDLLLFSQHVQRIELYHLKNCSTITEPSLMFAIEKESHEWRNGIFSPLHKSVLDIVEENQILEQLHVLVLKQEIFEEATTLINNLNEIPQFDTSCWLVSWATGRADSLRLAKSLNNNYRKTFSLGAVAVPCKIDNPWALIDMKEINYGFYKEGHVFCFFPLPLKTRLPFHINGCFQVTSNRKSLYALTEDDKGEKTNEWNEALMKDTIVRAIMLMIETVASNTSNHVDKEPYYCHWPVDCTEQVLSLKKSFYRQIVVENIRAFSSSCAWVSFQEILFLNPSLRKDDIGDIALEVLKTFPPRKGKTLIEMPEHILAALKESNQDRLQQINDAEINDEEFCLTFLKNIKNTFWNTKQEMRDKIVIFCLMRNRNAINEMMKKIECIPTEPSYVLRKPDYLVHPFNALSSLFCVSDGRFPVDMHCFRSLEVIQKLIHLGMNELKLSVELLIDRCESIALVADRCCECAQERCIAVNEYLSRNVFGLEKDLFERIKDMFIMPVLERPEDWKFSWNADTCTNIKRFEKRQGCSMHTVASIPIILGRPQYLFQHNAKDYVAMTENIVDESMIGHVFNMVGQQNLFGVKGHTEITLDVMVKQILVLVKEYNDQEDLFQQAKQIHDKIFNRLEKWVTSGDLLQNQHHASINALSGEPVVFVGSKLVKSNCVVFNLMEECKPYMYRLPESDQKSKRNIYEKLGVKHHFSIDYIVEVMNMLQENSNFGHCLQYEAFRSILEHLAYTMKTEGKTYADLQPYHDRILAPDSHCILYPTHELVIDSDDYETSTSMKMVHPILSPLTSALVGVKSKQHRWIQDISVGIPFGQHEDLTVRIHNLLKSYPCDDSIMKELLQNADDAGATEICFIKDYRTHPSTKIFGSEQLQGPALCVYNNSVFTEEDIKGIHDLGRGSKGDDPTKTGQYGVGFNAVYHLTDTPSFLTKGPGLREGGRLCIFDPLCKHVPQANKLEPGIMCQVDKVKRNFPDVIHGYSEDLLLTTDVGTVFRFPFRSEESSISKNVINSETMDSMIDTFKTRMSESLLFLKNVRRISLWNITSGSIVNEFYVSAQLLEESKVQVDTFNERVRSILKMNKLAKHLNLKEEVKEVIYEMEIKDSTNYSSQWIIAQRFGFRHDMPNIDSLTNFFTKGYLGQSPVGGIALPLQKDKTDATLQPMEENVKRSVDKLLASFTYKNASTVSLHCNDPSAFARDSMFKGKAFCFLPLPIHTGLPVHVNGHFALDHEVRRELWKEDGYQRMWNNSLLFEVIVPAWLATLLYLQKHVTDKINHELVNLDKGLHLYHSFFPVWESAQDEMWRQTIRAFYHSVSNQKIILFPTVVCNINDDVPCDHTNAASRLIPQLSWISVSCPSNVGNDKGVFNSVHASVSAQSSIMSDFAEYCNIIVHILKMLGMQIIETPLSIADSMLKADLKDIPKSTPQYVLKYLGTYGMNTEESCHLGAINVPIRETHFRTMDNLKLIIRYIQYVSQYYLQLEGLPILLTADMKIRQFRTNNPIYITKYLHLCSSKFSENFLHEDFIAMFNNKQTVNEVATTAIGTFLKPFTWRDFMRYLPYLFDSVAISSNQKIHWTTDDKEPISMEWLCCMYDFMHKNASMNNGKKCSTNYSQIRSMFDQLQNWSFLPCTEIKDSRICHELVPCSELVHVLHLPDIDKFQKVNSSLKKLRLTSLYVKAFVKCKHKLRIVHMVNQCIASPARPYELLKCLVHHKEQFCSNTTFTTYDGVQVLAFFSSVLEELSLINFQNDAKRMLRLLPVFETVWGTLTSINNDVDVLLVPQSIPVDGIDEWAIRSRVLLLRKIETLQSLYIYIGLSASSVLTLYRTHILPQFQNLNPTYWMTHITYVRDMIKKYPVQSLDEVKNILQILKEIAFVSVNGTMKRVGELYSPLHPVFKHFLDSSHFPPLHLRDADWQRFLEQLGLAMRMNGQLLLQFARQIALESQTSRTNAAFERSKILVDYFTDANPEKEGWDEYTMQQLKVIRFVQRYNVCDNFTAIFPQSEKEHTLICFDQAVSSKHEMICWTSVPLLPQELCIKLESKNVDNTLGILKVPTVEKVVLHCQNVCDALVGQMKSVQEDFFTNLMKLLYEFLTNNAMDDETVAKRLQYTPMIYLPTEHKLVMTSQIIIGLESHCEIKPYLYNAPVYYGMFFKLFQCLGAAANASIDHYCTVLQRVKDESKDEPLNVNELRIVQEAIRNIVDILVKGKPTTVSNQTLFLPNKKKVLLNANKLVISDDGYFERLLNGKISLDYFIGFHELKVTIPDIKSFVNSLPRTMQPELLTSLVCEDVYMQEMTINEFSRNAKFIEHFLHSEEFIHSVCCLVNDQFTLERTSYSNNMMSLIKVNLSQIEVRNVSGLKTILKYKGTYLNDTQKPKLCYTEYTDAGYKFYYECTSDNETIEPLLVSDANGLMALVNQCTGNILNNATCTYIHYFFAKAGRGINLMQQLDEWRISPYEGSQSCDQSAFPAPGTYVEEHYFPFLEQSIEPFQKEEFQSVAMELEDSAIVDDVDLRDPVYIYVHIKKEHINPTVSSQLAIKYDVDIGDPDNPVVRVPIYRLYRFVRTAATPGSELVKYDDLPINNLPVDENCRRIKQMLEDAWMLPEADKRRVIKRLKMKWYPDRNREHEAYCKHVFCYINYIVECLEQNKPVSADVNSQTVRTFTPSSGSIYNGMACKIVRQAEIFSQAYHSNLSDFRRPRRPRRGERGKSTSGAFSDVSYCREPVKDLGEAERWIRQAKCDYNAAEVGQHIAIGVHGYNWACYQCHQACEKALKAAWFVKDAEVAKTKSHSLSGISRSLDVGLSDTARRIETLLQIDGWSGGYTNMRYPDALSRPNIPSDLYNIDQAQKALELTKQLIDGVQEYIDKV